MIFYKVYLEESTRKLFSSVIFEITARGTYLSFNLTKNYQKHLVHTPDLAPLIFSNELIVRARTAIKYDLSTWYCDSVVSHYGGYRRLILR